jgi:hypothetical protein
MTATPSSSIVWVFNSQVLHCSTTPALVICFFVALYTTLVNVEHLLGLRDVQTATLPPTSSLQSQGAGGIIRVFLGNASSTNGTVEEERRPDHRGSRAACAGRQIYVYKLPPQFNQKLIESCGSQPGWRNMCYDLSNQGLGAQFDVPESDPLANVLLPRTAWFKTNQFSLELLFHERLKAYPCLTDDPEQAAMSYIPFYSALDLTPKLFENSVAVRDQLSERLVGWLQSNRHWETSGGKKHIMVLGRIVWDYVRPVNAFKPGAAWGNALLSFPELWNVTKLSIERNPWDSEQMAIPYPTSFHPASDVEMVAWQSTIRNAKRNKLVVFVGSPRYNKVGGTDLRRELMRQCSGAGNADSTTPWSDRDNNTTTAAAAAGIANSNRTKDPSRSCTMVLCNVVGCARNPQAPIRAFLEAVFCLQPPGDSATRKSFFDCLIAGGIPVLFDNMSAAQQYQWHLPGNTSSYAITFNRKQVVSGELDIVKRLLEIPQEVITSMRATITDMVSHFVYQKPGSKLAIKDAFDYTIDHLLQKFDAHVTI